MLRARTSLQLSQSTDQSRSRLNALQFAVAAVALAASAQAGAAISCARELTADVVAFDQPLMYNRLGAANINGMMYALKRDVVDKNGVPLAPAALGGQAIAGQVSLRPGIRPTHDYSASPEAVPPRPGP